MSKKLLNESTVRRFMGLANLAPLSESFLEEKVNEEEDVNEEAETQTESLLGLAEEDEDDEESAGDPSKTHPGELDYEGDAGDALELDAEIDDLEGDVEGGLGEQDLATRAKAILDDLAALLNQATGTEMVTVSDTEEGEGELEAELGADELEGGELEGEEVEDELELAEGVEDLDEDKPYTAKEEKPGEDKRKGAEKDGAEATKKKTSGTKRGTKKGDDAYKNESRKKKKPLDSLVAEITSKVIARLNK